VCPSVGLSVCLSVCLQCSNGLKVNTKRSFWYACISSEYLGRSRIKVIGSRSRAQEQKACLCISCPWGCLPSTENSLVKHAVIVQRLTSITGRHYSGRSLSFSLGAKIFWKQGAGGGVSTKKCDEARFCSRWQEKCKCAGVWGLCPLNPSQKAL